MKKIFLFLLAAVILGGCYTTLYPPANMDMSAANDIPDSTRQIIVNNYYETTEYYQLPRYQRYSLLWGSYYWDPFYYDYDYYHWRPYYWYGQYYYYNPHTHYWYYYDHHYPWHYGSWTGGSSGGRNDKERIHKPGYNVLTNTPSSSSVPFVSGSGNGQDRISKPVKKIGVDLNSGVDSNNEGYYTTSKPRVQSVGKTSLTTQKKNSDGNSGSTYKKPSTTTYKPQKRSSSSSSAATSSSSSGSKSSKPARSQSTSSKNSGNESSSSSSKKSK